MKVSFYGVYKTRGFCLIILIVVIIYMSGSIKLINAKEFVVFWPWLKIKLYYNRAVNVIPEAFPQQVSCLIFYLPFQKNSRWFSWRAVIRTSRGLSWWVIIFANNLLIISWLFSYILMESLWGNQLIYRNDLSNFI